MFKFPQVCPKIDITEIKKRKMTIWCRDLQSFFVLLKKGAKCNWSFYDYPKKRLTSVTRSEVMGTMLINGKPCLEIHEQEVEPRNSAKITGEETYRYILIKNGTVQIIRTIWRAKNKVGKMQDVNETPYPTRLYSGKKWKGHEIYTCGEKKYGKDELHHNEVRGVFNVTIRNKVWQCLKIITATWKNNNIPYMLTETFVSKKGRTILFRRYNGPGWKLRKSQGRYDKLKTHPKFIYKGVEYRLWYICLPDYSLKNL